MNQKPTLYDTKNHPIWLIMLIFILVFFVCIYFFRLPIEFQQHMDEGDFGRDLYNFMLVSEGKLPYIHFDWIYGPLVPLLYGLVFKIFGVSAFNALVLWFVLFIISILLLFYVVKSYSNSFMAFLASAFFILYYEGFLIQVFNHVTGLIFILLAILWMLRFFISGKIFYLYLLAGACFFLMMVKLNMGMAISLPILFFLILYYFKDKKSLKHILFATGIITCLLFLFYSFVFFNTPMDQINKSFPYFSECHTYFEKNFICFNSLFLEPFAPNLNNLFQFFYYFSSLNIWYFVIPFLGIIFLFILYKKEGLLSPHFKFILLLSVLVLASTHEYILIGSAYSLRIWSSIIVVVLVFYVINFILTEMTLNKFFKSLFNIFACFMFIVLFVKFYVFTIPSTTNVYNCTHPRLQISVLKFHWYHLMTNITKYIQDNTKPHEKIFGYPYCALYNFITDRRAPSRITEFLYISNISQADEQQIISDLEKHKVRIILNVEIQTSLNYGYGSFGYTHCKLLYDYIMKNYELDNSFYDDYLDGTRVPVYFYKRKTAFE